MCRAKWPILWHCATKCTCTCTGMIAILQIPFVQYDVYCSTVYIVLFTALRWTQRPISHSGASMVARAETQLVIMMMMLMILMLLVRKERVVVVMSVMNQWWLSRDTDDYNALTQFIIPLKKIIYDPSQNTIDNCVKISVKYYDIPCFVNFCEKFAVFLALCEFA